MADYLVAYKGALQVTARAHNGQLTDHKFIIPASYRAELSPVENLAVSQDETGFYSAREQALSGGPGAVHHAVRRYLTDNGFTVLQ